MSAGAVTPGGQKTALTVLLSAVMNCLQLRPRDWVAVKILAKEMTDSSIEGPPSAAETTPLPWCSTLKERPRLSISRAAEKKFVSTACTVLDAETAGGRGTTVVRTVGGERASFDATPPPCTVVAVAC